jgi:hypothetical protein
MRRVFGKSPPRKSQVLAGYDRKLAAVLFSSLRNDFVYVPRNAKNGFLFVHDILNMYAIARWHGCCGCKLSDEIGTPESGWIGLDRWLLPMIGTPLEIGKFVP